MHKRRLPEVSDPFERHKYAVDHFRGCVAELMATAAEMEEGAAGWGGGW